MFCFVDYRITNGESSNLERLGFEIIKIPKDPLLYSAIDGHVDIQMSLVEIPTKTPIFHRKISKDFLELLDSKDINYFLSSNFLKGSYPGDIILNALTLPNFILHNLEHTDPTLLRFYPPENRLHTKQGYTNCSTLKVSNTAFITSDLGISKVLEEKNLDVLLLPPGDIELPPLEYGFIGGTGGLISNDEMVFFGDLNFYTYGNLVKKFLDKHNVKPIYLKKGPLTDRGGLFVI